MCWRQNEIAPLCYRAERRLAAMFMVLTAAARWRFLPFTIMANDDVALFIVLFHDYHPALKTGCESVNRPRIIIFEALCDGQRWFASATPIDDPAKCYSYLGSSVLVFRCRLTFAPNVLFLLPPAGWRRNDAADDSPLLLNVLVLLFSTGEDLHFHCTAAPSYDGGTTQVEVFEHCCCCARHARDWAGVVSTGGALWGSAHSAAAYHRHLHRLSSFLLTALELS